MNKALKKEIADLFISGDCDPGYYPEELEIAGRIIKTVKDRLQLDRLRALAVKHCDAKSRDWDELKELLVNIDNLLGE